MAKIKEYNVLDNDWDQKGDPYKDYLRCLQSVLSTNEGVTVIGHILKELNSLRQIADDRGEIALHNLGVRLLGDVFNSAPIIGQNIITELLRKN